MRSSSPRRRAFTLIELLVVIAIIAILAIVVVLTLNPSELLKQSRDANRVSDMATLNSALNLYRTDQSEASSFSLGSSSSLYLSLPDSSSTCGSWGLPSLASSTYGYSCSSSSNYRNASSSGWLPVNLQNISAGSPISNLPVDPANSSSSGLYYAYSTTGSQYALMAIMESQKYRSSIQGGLGNGVDVLGSNVGVGPVGWWPLNEGSGTIAYDMSGNNMNGTWSGTATGTSGYYSAGSVSSWAGAFDGTTTYIGVGTSSLPLGTRPLSITAWVYPPAPSCASYRYVASFGTPNNNAAGLLVYGSCAHWYVMFGSSGGSTAESGAYLTPNTWNFIAGTYDGTTNVITDVNGILATSTITSLNVILPASDAADIGKESNGNHNYFAGNLLNDVRIYNRALSPAELNALYNAKN